jgi:hypothetical protein
MHGRKLEQRPEQLVSNWLRVRKLPEEIHCYRNAELRSNDMALSSPSVPYGDGFLTCEEHPVAGASKALLSDALGVGWPELGISNTEMRKMFPGSRMPERKAFWSRGLKSRAEVAGLHSFEMANGRLAWWFGGDLPDTRLAFDWGGVKGSRVLRGASEKRKVQWHFGITPQYRSGFQPYFRVRRRLLFSEDGKTALPGKRTHSIPATTPRRMRRSFAKRWRNARWRDMLLAFLFWLSDGESLIRLPLASSRGFG